MLSNGRSIFTSHQLNHRWSTVECGFLIWTDNICLFTGGEWSAPKLFGCFFNNVKLLNVHIIYIYIYICASCYINMVQKCSKHLQPSDQPVMLRSMSLRSRLQFRIRRQHGTPSVQALQKVTMKICQRILETQRWWCTTHRGEPFLLPGHFKGLALPRV